jgi:hypothetical protein
MTFTPCKRFPRVYGTTFTSCKHFLSPTQDCRPRQEEQITSGNYLLAKAQATNLQQRTTKTIEAGRTRRSLQACDNKTSLFSAAAINYQLFPVPSGTVPVRDGNADFSFFKNRVPAARYTSNKKMLAQLVHPSCYPYPADTSLPPASRRANYNQQLFDNESTGNKPATANNKNNQNRTHKQVRQWTTKRPCFPPTQPIINHQSKIINLNSNL